MTQEEMTRRFQAYQTETTRFIFGPWANMTISERDAAQAEIDARHSYKHGWIMADGHSFNIHDAFPNETFANVWD
jgi:hypothetical protein